MNPIRSRRAHAAIGCLLFRSGSYTSPAIHNQCNSTASFSTPAAKEIHAEKLVIVDGSGRQTAAACTAVTVERTG
jgi:hypothetical protein